MSATFHYTARSGEGRFVAGAIAAENVDQALAHLRTRALFVTSLAPAGSSKAMLPSLFTVFPVDASARVAFFRSFATLIRAGVPLRRALDITVEQQAKNGRLSEALASIASDIENGMALSDAMARRPREFPRLFVAMIRAGEIGGVLDDVLERLATMLERDRALRKRVASAMTYPAIVIAASVALVLFLVSTTVPAFASMFEQMRVELPLSTRVLIAIGTALHQPFAWVTILGCVVGLVLSYRAALRFAMVRTFVARVAISMPPFGVVVRKATIARFSRTLGMLLRSGVQLAPALDAATDVVENELYRQGVGTIGEAIARGEPFVAPLEASGLFEGLYVQLMRVGEETGALDAMLVRLAEYYELDVETALSTLAAVIEPALIIFLGATVGTIVASVLIPLYSMIGSIK